MIDAVARLQQGLLRPAEDSSDYDLNPGYRPPEGRTLRAASVMIALIDGPAGPEVVLTRRSSLVQHHPGQISFPGGKAEPFDASPEATALREAQEEIGLDPSQVDLLGRMPAHETVTGYMITPVLAQIRGSCQWVPDPGEVAEVFQVPFAHLSDPARFRIERRMWQGQWRSYYVVPWGPYYIWGATARILRSLAGRLAP